jgi:hypothetical protein
MQADSDNNEIDPAAALPTSQRVVIVDAPPACRRCQYRQRRRRVTCADGKAGGSSVRDVDQEADSENASDADVAAAAPSSLRLSLSYKSFCILHQSTSIAVDAADAAARDLTGHTSSDQSGTSDSGTI